MRTSAIGRYHDVMLSLDRWAKPQSIAQADFKACNKYEETSMITAIVTDDIAVCFAAQGQSSKPR